MAAEPIVLVRPRWPYPIGRGEATYNRVWPPLSFAYAAALARGEGRTVRILDAHAERHGLDALARAVPPRARVVVTSSSFDRWQCPNVDIAPFVEACRVLRRDGREVYAAGFHGTAEPAAVLEATGADGVVLGEPEFVVADLAAGRVSAAVFRPGDDPAEAAARRARADVAALPVPAWDALPAGAYRYALLPRRFALMETARGCPHACAFCTHLVFGGGVRRKSVEQVAAEAAALRAGGVESVYVMDLEFAADRDFALAVCDVLGSSGLLWCCQSRLDGLADDLVARMAASGCRLVHTGIESGSPRVLRAAGKSLDLDAVTERTRALEAAGIDVLAFFLFGLPGETNEEMEETLRFARRLAPAYVSFHPFVPYAGQRMAEGERRGCRWWAPSPRGKAMAKKALLRFYLSPRRLWRGNRASRPRGRLRAARIFLSYLLS
jgi:radical SAM superfamily enzyme YgiQ (UPF0313 family)